MTNADFSLLDI